MFAPLSRFLNRRLDPAELEHSFVRELRVSHPREPRSRRSEKILCIGWVLVILKSVAVHWACHRYNVPINPWWLIVPTLVFAALCTLLYWRRD